MTFHLVHRSQKDPLAADETAPQRVLVPIADKQAAKHDKNADKDTKDIKVRKEQQQKFGIFFDDDYNYLQHLKDVNNLSTEWERVEPSNQDKKNSKPEEEKSKIQLPSSVFESSVEEKVGLLNKAAPVSGLRLDLDPEVVAAMDDDFDFDDPDNELEDNFMELANVGESGDEFDDSDEDEEDDEDNINVSDDEDGDELGSLSSFQDRFKDEETRSRFTEYSMSSSVMKRNDQLTLLDGKFERAYAGYDDTEIGALDCDEIEGFVEPNSDLVMQCAEEYEHQLQENTENVAKLFEDRMKIIHSSSDESDDDDELESERLVVEARERDKWDCESILSTYSNIYNHPKLISEPKTSLPRINVDAKTGIPRDVLTGKNGGSQLTASNLKQFDNEHGAVKTAATAAQRSTISMLSVRPKDETPEERRERKLALKNHRRERRVERKANINAFKEEKKRQERILLNEKRNIQGNRIL